MLKSTLIFALAMATSLANQDGYYHNQYQYKSTSSSYKNNELQHKTDDEEFSSIHGDLAGRQDPKVDQYSQHTEYKNPNSQAEDQHGTNFGTGAYQSGLGSSAYTGSNGYHGTSGYTGSSGYRGSAGVQGSTGYRGASGLQGSTGIHGTTGLHGATGLQGATSLHGTTGLYGTAGNSAYERSSSYERSNSYGSTSLGANQYNQNPISQNADGSYTSTYQMSSASQLNRGDYDTQSNLYDISKRLQNELSEQLSQALTRKNTYGTSRETEIQAIESELRSNITRQIQEELQRQYGSQTRRGGYSYPTSGSQYQQQANYNTQELDDLTQQVQTNLLNQLKNEYKTYSSYSSESSYNTKTGSRYRPTTYVRPAETYVRPTETYVRPTETYVRPTETYVRPAQTRVEPVIRPSTPLLDLTTQVQNDLDTQLNVRLMELQSLYFNDATFKSRNQPDYDLILENLLSEIKRNLTSEMDRALRNSYGYQEFKDGYFFSTWNVASNIANYKQDQLDDLKQQVENNLRKKITDTIKDQRVRYFAEKRSYESRQTQSFQTVQVQEPIRYPNNNQYSSSHSSQAASSSSFAHQRPVVQPTYSQTADYNSQSQYGSSHTNTGRYPSSSHASRGDTQQVEEFDYQYSPTTDQRPVGHAPNSDSLTQGVYAQPAGNAYRSTSNSDSSYRYISGQRQSGIEYTPSTSTQQVSTQELASIRNQLQEDLSQQVRNAIYEQQHQTGYTSSSAYQPASTQVVNDLSEEFKRNFSRKVEDVLKQHGVRGGYSFSVTTSGNLQNGQNNQRLQELTNKLQDDLLRQLREGLTVQSTSSGYGSSQKTYGGRYTASSGFREVDYASDMSQQTEDCMQNDQPAPIIEVDPEVQEITNPKAEFTRTNTEMKQVHKNYDDQEILGQQTENFDQQISVSQNTEDLTQQTEDLSQSTVDQEDLSQQTEDFGQKFDEPLYHNPAVLNQKFVNPDFDDRLEEIDQQTSDLSQITQDTMDSYQSQSFPLFTPQRFENLKGAPKKPQTTEENDYDSQKIEDILEQNVADQQQIQTEVADDFEQKHTPHQHASVVQDVGHQEQKIHAPILEKVENQEVAENHELEMLETPETTTKAGFWSKLGGKISDSFKKAKDKVQAIG